MPLISEQYDRSLNQLLESALIIGEVIKSYKALVKFS